MARMDDSYLSSHKFWHNKAKAALEAEFQPYIGMMSGAEAPIPTLDAEPLVRCTLHPPKLNFVE